MAQLDHMVERDLIALSMFPRAAGKWRCHRDPTVLVSSIPTEIMSGKKPLNEKDIRRILMSSHANLISIELNRSGSLQRASGRTDRTAIRRAVASAYRRTGTALTHRFWPIGESAQADYETLREAVLQGQSLQSLAAARFVRRGLAGLIAWPGAEPVYVATVKGAIRAPWTPHADPRLDALAAGYELILSLRAEHRTARTTKR